VCSSLYVSNRSQYRAVGGLTASATAKKIEIMGVVIEGVDT
jgi:hypothetical protein